MDNRDFACRLTDDIYSTFRFFEDLDVLKILDVNEDFLLALVLSYFMLSKDKILTKTKEIHDPVLRLERHVPENYIESLFDGRFSPYVLFPSKEQFDSFVKYVGKRDENSVISNSDYHLWCMDDFRDSFMHDSSLIIDDAGDVRFINDMDDRRLFSDVPISWFFRYINSNPLSMREFSKYTIKGFYFNNLEKDNKKFISERLLNDTIMYRVNVNSCDDSKFNALELTKLVSDKMLEYSSLEVSLEDIKKYEDLIPKSLKKYDIRYLVSFYKARDKVEKILKEKYSNINVDIYIDERKDKVRKKIKNNTLPSYLNYQDVWNAFNYSLEKKSEQLLRAMYNFYNFIREGQNTDKSRDELVVELSQKLLGNDSILSSDDNVYYDSLNKTRSMLKIILFYIYGINTLVLNGSLIKDSYYLDILTKKCNAGKKDNYDRHMRQLLCRVKELEIGLSNCINKLRQYCNFVNSQNGSNSVLRQERYNEFLNVYQNALSRLQRLRDELDFKPFYTNRNNRLKCSRQHQALTLRLEDALNTLMDITTDKDIREEKVDEVKTVVEELKDIEKDFIFGTCNGEDTLALIRNCLAHPGRIDYKSSSSNMIQLNDYNERGNKSGVCITAEKDFIDIIYGSMKSFKELYSPIYHK